MTTIKAIFHLLCLTPMLLQAQPEISWQRCYGSSGWDAFADVEMTSDGGYITSVEYGSTDFDTTGVSGLERPATLMKFDSAFNLLWYSSFGGYTNASNFFELAVLEDKGFIAFGNTYASDSDFADNHGPNYSDLMLVRTDSLGQKLWSKCYGSPGDDFPASFMVTKDKCYLLLGYSNSEGGDVPDHYGTGFSHDIIIIKTDSLGNESVRYLLLTGSMNSDQRAKAVTDFQHDATIQVFLISIQAGGTCLNLTAADYVFILDPWWNPFVEMQAVARAHRIGRTNSVFVTRFISKDTIEEKIMRLKRNNGTYPMISLTSMN